MHIYSTLIYFKDPGESVDSSVDVLVREESLCQDSCFSAGTSRLQENSTKMGGPRSSPSTQSLTIVRMTAKLTDDLLPYMYLTNNLVVACGRIGCIGCWRSSHEGLLRYKSKFDFVFSIDAERPESATATTLIADFAK
jgi:hypothetical protein